MSEIAKEEKSEKVGGLAFFLSFFSLAILSALNIFNLFKLFIRAADWTEWRFFLLGIVLGSLFAQRFIKGWVSVFLHELRHAILSNLVGNKWKGLEVKDQSGHFEYAYTAKTARFNAFVALAPYWLPLFTVVGGGASVAVAFKYRVALLIAVAFFYGIDLVLNFRDISPVQSDITEIKGGYGIGLFYIVIVNTFLFTIMAAWVTDGVPGLKFLVLEIWRMFSVVIK